MTLWGKKGKKRGKCLTTLATRVRAGAEMKKQKSNSRRKAEKGN